MISLNGLSSYEAFICSCSYQLLEANQQQLVLSSAFVSLSVAITRSLALDHKPAAVRAASRLRQMVYSAECRNSATPAALTACRYSAMSVTPVLATLFSSQGEDSSRECPKRGEGVDHEVLT